ncbi:AVAST type 1 anti-phage system MBL fold metallo-hydrolase Avs1a [Paenibacillus sp. FSL K6-1122]|uniref:AVAST type 1 anti-phage system MBL fold metallo-hydrolase Avs1a n=1 Tax=Paenibacillus sp. FSL K6-1122 TaxID=2954512 RepID=UPI0030ED2499
MTNIKVEVYPALEGDCFLICIGDRKKTNILVDGGFASTYHNYLKPRLLEMAENGEELSLVIVTHVDADHIEGIIELFKENGTAENPLIIPIKEVWHNSYRHLNFLKQKSVEELDVKEESILSGIISKSYVEPSKSRNNPNKGVSARDGSTLAALLYKEKYSWNNAFNGSAVNLNERNFISLTSEISLNLLSPDSNKLKRLEKFWLTELRKSKYDFKLNDNILFDDAYEFYLLSQKDEHQVNESKNISYQKEKTSLNSVLNKKMIYDNSVVNGSSISFILEYKDYKLLFLADSHPDIVRENIQGLVDTQGYIPFFDVIKVAHHGSHRNTSTELLSLIDSSVYLFSTNGKKNNHPNNETIARIISRKGTERRLIFNYFIENELLANEDLKKEYRFIVEFSDEFEIKVIEI